MLRLTGNGWGHASVNSGQSHNYRLQIDGELADMPTAPDIVYHYTDQSGLIGILQTKELWCTHIACLNDASEYTFAKKLYCEMLVALAQDQSQEQRMRDYASWVKELLDQEDAEQDNESASVPNCYVTSFSEAEDDLSQWRAYTKTGSRFSIGFRGAILEALAKYPNGKFEPVTYGRESVLDEMKNEFVRCMREKEPSLYVGEETNRPVQHGHRAAYTNVNRTVLREVAVRSKNDAFAQEEEWRLSYVIPWNQCEFRTGKSFVIPYFKKRLDVANPIATITVGPSPHKRLSAFSVKGMLTTFGWGDIEVKESTIPYRDW